jgi:hypothetical protein
MAVIAALALRKHRPVAQPLEQQAQLVLLDLLLALLQAQRVLLDLLLALPQALPLEELVEVAEWEALKVSQDHHRYLPSTED